MRSIIVSSTRTGGVPTRVVTAATNWGELKPDLIKEGITFENLKVVVRETGNNLENDSDGIPEGTFSLTMLPIQAKAGLC